MLSNTIEINSTDRYWRYLLLPIGILWTAGQFYWWHLFSFPYGAQIAYMAAKFGVEIDSGRWKDVLTHISFSTYYPPLYEFLLGYVHALIGYRLENAIIFNTVLTMLAAYAIYLVVRGKTSDAFAGAMAVVLFLSHGMVFALARIPVREVALLTATAWMLYILENRKILRHPIFTLLFTVLYSLGMLTKWTFPLYTLVPAVIVFAIRLIEGLQDKERGRWRAPLLIGFCLVVGIAFCGPWYLGVLDLKYLWASAANDPTPGSPFFRLVYYFDVMTVGTVFGNWSTYLLLGMSCAAVVLYRNRALIPALSFFSGIFFLFAIGHKEPRYVLGAMPAMMILSGMTLGKIPQKILLRIPFLIVLISLGTYNFSHLSFIEPKLPHSSGDLWPLPAASCLHQGQQTTERIIELAASLPEEKFPIEMATHPLNRNLLMFDRDLFSLLIWSMKQEENIHFAGFDLVEYTLFDNEKDNLDLIIVTDNVWNDSREAIAEQMQAWLDFRSADWEKKNELPGNPRQRLYIEMNFTEAMKVETECFPTVHVYIRNNLIIPSTESHSGE